MKVVLADILGCRYPDLGFQIKTALEQLGHSVVPFDYRLHHLQHFSFTNKWLNKRLVRTAVGCNADLVIVHKGETILPGTVSAITKAGIKVVNWNPDEPFGELQAFNRMQNIPEYDAVFTYDTQYVERLKEHNPHSYHLPAGADPHGVHKEHVPLDKRTFPAALCMVGTAYPNRVDMLAPFADKTLRIAGPGWDKTSMASMSLPHVKINEMVGLFNESKIVLNPHGTHKSFIVPNPRTFEIPATRSFELTDLRRDAELFFKPGKEIVIYKDLEEFKELVDYYLVHDEERNTIAQAGHDRVLKEHTIKHRMETMLRLLRLPPSA